MRCLKVNTLGATGWVVLAACMFLGASAQASQFNLSSAAYSVNESSSQITITVQASPTPTGSISVKIISSNGSAIAGNDYTAVNTTVNFSTGQASQSVIVNISNDTLIEANETFTVALSAPSTGNSLGTPSTATVTIVDNDTLPTIQFAPTTYTVSESSISVGLTVTLSRAYQNTITVNYSTSNGTASSPSDYAAVTGGSVSFPGGSTSASITITINNDTLQEPSETFTVTLNSTSAGTLSATAKTATVTINDNDTVPTVKFSVATYSANESASNAVITVSLSAAIDKSVTVKVSTSNGTAFSSSDYGAVVSQTLTINAGATSTSFNVSIINDTLSEGNETFTATLSAPTNATLGTPNPATVTIVDDDIKPSVYFSTATYSVQEPAGPAVLTVVLSQAVGHAVTVTYSTGNGSATSSTDFTGASSSTFTITSGLTSGTISIPITNDTLSEINETFTVSISVNASQAVLGSPSTATVTITDDDVIPNVSFTQSTSWFWESGTTVSIPVVLSQSVSKVVMVNYNVTNGTASAGSDYSATANGTLSFPAGTTTALITITPLQDALQEQNETISLGLSPVVGGNCTIIAPSTAVVTIYDEDTPRTLAFTQTGYSVNENAGTAQPVVSINQAVPYTVFFTFTTTNGSAVAPGDYTTIGSTHTLSGTTTSVTVPVTIINDAIVEGVEGFTAAISNITPTSSQPVLVTLGTQTSTSIQIIDDDFPPVVSLTTTVPNTSEIDLPNKGVITVARTGSTGSDIIVNVAITGTATLGVDYVATLTLDGINHIPFSGTTIAIPVGFSSVQLVLDATDDTIFEGSESVIVTLQTGTGYTIGTPSSGTVTISDNDTNSAPAIISGPTATPNPVVLEP